MPPITRRPRGTPVKGEPEPVRVHPAPMPTPAPIETPVTRGVGPLMISSLPTMASGADAYARQYYRPSGVPFRRYLPIRSQ